MKTEIPQFLLEMSEQMNSDPNRCTSHPYWQVRNKVYLVTESGYNEDHFEVVSDNEDYLVVYHSKKSEDMSELSCALFEYEKGWCENWFKYECEDEEFTEENFYILFEEKFNLDYDELPEPYKKIHLQEIEEVLTTHMTQADAEWFIRRKKHDYPNAYTYVASAVWSPQFRELQDWIKGLTKG